MKRKKTMNIDNSAFIQKCIKHIKNIDKCDIEKAIIEYVYDDINRDISDKSSVVKQVMDYVDGYDFLQPLMEQKGITEVMVNAGRVFYEKSGMLHEYEKKYTKKDVDRLVNILCRKTDRTVNFSSPVLDGSIGHDIRVNIVLEPVADNGTSITIRRFPDTQITYQDMSAQGFFNDEIMEFLKDAVKTGSNIFICGGAGSGKTTLLNVLTGFIPSDERVITIEDSTELEIKHIKNTVRLVCRNPNSEGKGSIGISELIRSSLRMRPDRIIVGEVRGGEAFYMLSAMNTGHSGSISTGHANSCKDAFSRLETMVLSECDMPLSAIRKQICDALDIVISLGRINTKRVVTEIVETEGFVQNDIKVNRLFSYDVHRDRHVRMNDAKKSKRKEWMT